MKKIILSSFSMLAIASSSLHADVHGLYLGLGYSSTNIDLTIEGLSDKNQKILDSSTDSIVLQAGYDFNEYFGIEGRYYINNSSLAYQYYLGNIPLSDTYEAESLTIYIKPQYNLGFITLYGLLGMSANNYTANNLLGADDDILFSWGGGAKFNVTQSLGLFVDYTDLGENDETLTFAFKDACCKDAGHVAAESEQGWNYGKPVYSNAVHNCIHQYGDPWQVAEVLQKAKHQIEGEHVWQHGAERDEQSSG